MSRIQGAFARAKGESRLAIVAFITAGYPEPEATPRLVRALVEGGADVIELGVPFSDPLAEGPTIQRASNVALQAGMTPRGCIGIAAELRREGIDAPIILMGYYNPILAFGPAAFVREAARAGVDGLIVVDLPPEESDELRSLCAEAGIDFIFLLAPTSTDERIAMVAERATGFVYCVSVTGVTGARSEMPASLPDFLARVRARTGLPLAVGFGVSKPEHVRSLAGIADGAVVGSAIIDIIESSPPGEREARAREYVASLRAAAVKTQM